MHKSLIVLSLLAAMPLLSATAAEAQEQENRRDPQAPQEQMSQRERREQMNEQESMEPAEQMGQLDVMGSAGATKRHHVTGMVGFQLFDLTDEFDDAGADFDQQVTFDGRYEYRLTPRWGIEGFVTYSPARADIFGDTAETDVDAWYTTGGVTYYILPEATVNPFVFGGLGAAILDVSGGDTESYLAGNFGGGVEVPVHRAWSIRIEARDFIYSVDDLDATSAAALGLPEGFDEVVNDLQFSGGVTISF